MVQSYTGPYTTICDEFGFRCHPIRFLWTNRWIIDAEIAVFLKQWIPELSDATMMNRSLMRSGSEWRLHFLSQEWNPKGIYRHEVRRRGGKQIFYYVSARQTDPPPQFNHTIDEWLKFKSHNRIRIGGRNKRKKPTTPIKDDETATTAASSPPSPEQILEEALETTTTTTTTGTGNDNGNNNNNEHSNASSDSSAVDFFDRPVVSKIFGPRVNEETTRKKLERWIESLEMAEQRFDCFLTLVNKGQDEPPPNSCVPKMLMRMRVLRLAYERALHTMEDGATWTSCCKYATERSRISKSGLQNWRTVQRANVAFRVSGKFPHPNWYIQIGKKPCPCFLAQYPEALPLLQKWASQHLETLSCEMAAMYIRDSLIPLIYKKEQQTDTEDGEPSTEPLTLDEFRQKVNLPSVSVGAAWKILTYAGFRFSETKKTYYTDRHEDADNVQARKQFISKYFELEKLAHRWIQIPSDQAIKLENGEIEGVSEKLMKDVWAFEFRDPSTNQTMREYHVDCFPDVFSSYIRDENKLLGGNLSHRFPSERRPVVLVGQDEAIFKQWSFSKKSWGDHKGRGVLLPKDDGHGLMLSAFVSRAWGFYSDNSGEVVLLTPEKLEAINQSRRAQTYLAEDSASQVLGGSSKRIRQITDASAFCTYFDYGSNNDGWWNYDHMALQFEDLVDCLMVLYPSFDFAFLFDNSSGHGRKQKDGLNEKTMNKDWGGVVPKMHETIVECIGPYPHPHRLQPGSKQSMVYTDADPGPFAYKGVPLTEEQRQRMKFDHPTNQTKKHKLSKKELIGELIRHDIQQGAQHGDRALQAYHSKSLDQLQAISTARQLPTEVDRVVMEQGWLGQPKGLFQVLGERGFIDTTKLQEYRKDMSKTWLDGSGQVREDKMEEYKKYSLTYLMGSCEDFKNERSALEQLAADLSQRYSRNLEILVTPKYHCELAGEGIEYAWGLGKRYFRRLTRNKKGNKTKFMQVVRDSMGKVSLRTVRRFSAKARRYMLTYLLFDSRNQSATDDILFVEIEKYVNVSMKTHRCTLDQEHSFIQQVWKEAQEAER